jgi:hypothetical protein
MLPLLFSLFPAAALAQSPAQPPCTGEGVLIDDFATKEQKYFDNANRWINKLGGDYGTDAASTFDIDTTSRVLTMIPRGNGTDSFFFAKYDQIACFDLTKYSAFQFDLEAPVGAQGAFTLTQTNPACTARVDDGDSVYIGLENYYKNDGTKQTITLPFIDFARRSKDGQPFDMVHLKDWTFVSMVPTNQPFKFSNMRLLGGPLGCAIPNVAPPQSSPPVTTPNDSSKQQTLPPGVASGASPSKSFVFGFVIGVVPLLAYALI